MQVAMLVQGWHGSGELHAGRDGIGRDGTSISSGQPSSTGTFPARLHAFHSRSRPSTYRGMDERSKS
jgi:hypothetical protein